MYLYCDNFYRYTVIFLCNQVLLVYFAYIYQLCAYFFFFLMIRPPPRSTLFPYPPLFRSNPPRVAAAECFVPSRIVTSVSFGPAHFSPISVRGCRQSLRDGSCCN